MSLIIIAFVFLITIINTIVTSYVSARIIKEEASQNNIVFLTKLNHLVENRMSEINNGCIKFCNRISAKNIEETILDHYNRYTLQKEIDLLAGSYDAIDSIYIFFFAGRSVFFNSPVSGINYVTETETFFDKHVYYDFIKDDKLFTVIGARPISPRFILGNGEKLYDSSVISFVRRFPVNAPASKDIMVINIKDSYLVNVIDDNYLPDGSSVLISDPDGGILLHYNRSTEAGDRILNSDLMRLAEYRVKRTGPSYTMNINDESVYITELATEPSGRIYTLIIPERELFKSVNKANVTIFILLSILLVLSVLFAKLVERRFYIPALSILRRLSGRDDGTVQDGNEFAQINGYISQILDDNLRQVNQIKDHFSSDRKRMLFALMSGEKEAVRLFHEDGVMLGGEVKWIGAIVIRVWPSTGNKPADESADPMNMMVDTIAGRLLSYGQVDKVRISQEQSCVLLSARIDLDAAGLKQAIASDVQETQAALGCRVRVGIGRLYASMKEIRQSFLEADELAQDDAGSQNCLVRDSGDAQADCQPHDDYPYNLECRILSCLESNDDQACRESIRAFCSYIGDNRIGIKRVKKYFLVLIYNISKQLGKNNREKEKELLMKTAFEDLDHLDTFREVEEWALSLLEGCLDTGEHHHTVNNLELIEKVEQYIKKHYMEEIGLPTIAEYVYMSPSYLRKIFKEATGYTFIDYMIKVRMEAAARLLLNKDVKITDIVEKVGYLSIQSFSRIFHKYYNCTPSDYRKIHAKKHLDFEDSLADKLEEDSA